MRRTRQVCTLHLHLQESSMHTRMYSQQQVANNATIRRAPEEVHWNVLKPAAEQLSEGSSGIVWCGVEGWLCTCGVPLYGVDLVLVALKSLQRLRVPQLAHVDHLVRAAGREGRVVAPVHVQRRRCTCSKVPVRDDAQSTLACQKLVGRASHAVQQRPSWPPEALCIAPGDAVKKACSWGAAEAQAQPVQCIPCKSSKRGQLHIWQRLFIT